MTTPNGATPPAFDAFPMVVLLPAGILSPQVRAVVAGFNGVGIRVEGEVTIEPMGPETVLEAFLQLARAGVIGEVVPGPDGQDLIQPLSGAKRLTVCKAPPPARRIITLE